MSPEPWYAGGLRFTCTMCGKCCTGEPGFVWVDEAELARIAEVLNEPVEEVRAFHAKPAGRGMSLREKANGDCTFYDREKGCLVYEARPRQCRTWPFWESNVATPEAWERAKQVCPGSGKGELILAEEITRRVKVIRL